MNKRHLLVWGFVLLFFILGVQKLLGQQNNSLYFFDRIPQSIQLNPAHQPTCRLYLGAPALSGLEINGGNSSLAFGDILIYNKDIDKLVTPLYSESIARATIAKLGKQNSFYSDLQVDLASFGFKIGNSYVSFLISDKVNVSTNLPKDIFQFAYDLIDVGKSYDFNGLSVKANYYREYSIGYSQQIDDKLYFGIRGKMLFGKANISTRESDITINEPNNETIELNTAVSMNVSIPHLNVYTNKIGELDSAKFRDFDHTSDIIKDVVLLKDNKGFAFDLGFQYNMNEKITFSGSLLDLGYINWKVNVHNLAGGGNYDFHGIKMDPNDSTGVGQALVDTLKKVYDVQVSSDPYSTFLSPKLYLGVSYAPFHFLKLGLLSRSEIIYKTWHQQLTGSVILYPTQIFGASLSYTIADGVYDNFGFGMVLRTGPFQMYLMTDRIPLIYNKDKSYGYIPVNAKNINFRLGFNLVFGANTKRKLLLDKPFLE